MAFVDGDLTMHAYNSTIRSWDYTTSDDLSTVMDGVEYHSESSGYFSDGGYKLRPGDYIRVEASDGKAMLLISASTWTGSYYSVAWRNVAYVDTFGIV
jgi:uncharacterized cupin superfamily protein